MKIMSENAISQSAINLNDKSLKDGVEKIIRVMTDDNAMRTARIEAFSHVFFDRDVLFIAELIWSSGKKEA